MNPYDPPKIERVAERINAASNPVKLLRESSSDWVERLAQGANWMFIGALLDFSTNSLSKQFPSIGPLIELCPDVLYFIGIWLITAPEPDEPHRPTGIRAITRAVGVLGVMLDIAIASISYLSDSQSLAFRGLSLVLGSMLLFLVALHLANLSTRIPDLRLATQSRFVFSAIAFVSLVFGTFVLYVGNDEAVLKSLRDNALFAAAAIPVLLAMVILAFWSVWILFRFYRLAKHESATHDHPIYQPSKSGRDRL